VLLTLDALSLQLGTQILRRIRGDDNDRVGLLLAAPSNPPVTDPSVPEKPGAAKEPVSEVGGKGLDRGGVEALQA
jgi:hypothetical protein